MGKSLQEMPLDELWEQFPISLVPPGKDWERLYDGIRSILGIYPDKRISHTGSTAIHGIWTEDIVDVLVDVPVDTDIRKVAEAIGCSGFRLYTEMCGESGKYRQNT